MSISYVKAIQSTTNEAVFASGIKYFLYKKIKSQEQLLLPHWRNYEVRGQRRVYTVRIPLAHNLKTIQEVSLLGQILVENTTCDCPYFVDYGICKHIVAVCAAVDDEFELSSAKRALELKNIDQARQVNILDKVFGVQKNKQQSEYLTNLFNPNAPSFMTREMVLEVEREIQNSLLWGGTGQPTIETLQTSLWIAGNSDFESWFQAQLGQNPIWLVSHINQAVIPQLGFYKEEKKIITLVDKSAAFWRYTPWLWLTLNWAGQMTVEHQAQIHYYLFKLAFTGLASSHWTELYKSWLKALNLDLVVRDAVMELIVETFGLLAEITINFGLMTQDRQWVSRHLEDLSTEYILQSTRLLPDEFERIDTILNERARAWVDYLQSDSEEYGKLNLFLHSWAETLGSTPHFETILSSIRQQHSKKKSLISLLRDLD